MGRCFLPLPWRPACVWPLGKAGRPGVGKGICELGTRSRWLEGQARLGRPQSLKPPQLRCTGTGRPGVRWDCSYLGKGGRPEKGS